MRLGLFIIFLSSISFRAQNLIPDSSFERNKAIPADFSGIGNSNYWTRPSMGTTDLFCISERKRRMSPVGVPQNAMGYQFPHSGTCYAGFFLFSHGDYREYLQTPLIKPLEKDKWYQVSLYISLANYSRTYIDQIGFGFLPEEQHFNTGDVLTEIKEEYIKLEKAERDTSHWRHLTKKYKADGTEKYFIIGSFNINKIKRTGFSFPKYMKSPINKTTMRDSYYYVDDVSITEIENPEEVVSDTLKKINTPDSTTTFYFQFNTNSSELKNEALYELDKVVTYLNKNAGDKVEIAGHTDNTGNEFRNLRLSVERAESVANYLVLKGIQRERISYTGFGGKVPLEPNNSEENKRKNRRVELTFLKK